ncbi:hypothetical protein GTV32_14595 [Gordonia sp. SID5947]|uniref:hypothetical protein n=1 Tax=Gordonia sp. SID5947 TaxID=2690315 RepID=UPI001369160D|nr:hypothetical protein [Gordonia sp. SID5947]MYR07457.1 hypothetical protein [Gordonia sp. SID5947]
MTHDNDNPPTDWRIYAGRLTGEQIRRLAADERHALPPDDLVAAAQDMVRQNDFQRLCDSAYEGAVDREVDTSDWIEPEFDGDGKPFGPHDETYRELTLRHGECRDLEATDAVRLAVRAHEFLSGARPLPAWVELEIRPRHDRAELSPTHARALAARLIELADIAQRTPRAARKEVEMVDLDSIMLNVHVGSSLAAVMERSATDPARLAEMIGLTPDEFDERVQARTPFTIAEIVQATDVIRCRPSELFPSWGQRLAT